MSVGRRDWLIYRAFLLAGRYGFYGKIETMSIRAATADTEDTLFLTELRYVRYGRCGRYVVATEHTLFPTELRKLRTLRKIRRGWKLGMRLVWSVDSGFTSHSNLVVSGKVHRIW